MKQSRISLATLLGTILSLLWTGPLTAQSVQRVKFTVHNLSVSGPGRVRAATETEVCIFCHTPHSAVGVKPLWSRSLATGPYLIYQSSSLRAKVGQPTGASKLCLSCHDGTIALGSVLSRPLPIALVGGGETMPPGPALLGTDLSDDHPVSFSYAASLSDANPELVAPEAITPPVKLDRNSEVQCTSCHDPHDNTHGDFLVRPNDASALCESCHQKTSWSSSAHARSTAVVPGNVATVLGADLGTTAQNACKSCHRTHRAGGLSWILHLEGISSTCLPCHDGSVASGNIQAELSKFSSHGITTEGPPGATGGPYLEGTRLSCADCHNPHAAGSTEGLAANVPTSLAQVSGVSLNGTPVTAVSHEYELCLRCHGDSAAAVDTIVSRVLVQPNKRLQFQATNPSFHPVGNPGANLNVPSLLPPLTTASVLTCGDCHSSDGSRKLGGIGPAGPHGSAFRPLLAQRYDTADFTIESPGAYALCYRCHQRDSILRNDSFPGHSRHVVEQSTPCSVCHDSHGISSAQGDTQKNSHLMNFDRSVVFANAAGRLEFNDVGLFHGECYLSCHGEDHNPERY